MKKLITIMTTLAILSQSLSLSIIANNAIIADITAMAASETEVIINFDNGYEYNDRINNLGEYNNEPCDDAHISQDNTGHLNETTAQYISRLLDINMDSAHKMIFEYGSEENAAYEAESYNTLKEMFYFLDNPSVSDMYTDMVVNGKGAYKVALSGIVAYVLGVDISEVIIKDDELPSAEELFVERFAQQFYVSPTFIYEYTARTGTTAETLYQTLIFVLQKHFPDAFPQTISIEDSERSIPYPDSPFYSNISEHERISPSSGALTYTINLATIPGINGMDIDLSLRYDMDKSVVQGEYAPNVRVESHPRYDSNGNVIGSFANVYFHHDYKQFDWSLKSPFLLGAGWRLNYDYIYRRDDTLYLELTDGREYKITGTSPKYSLDGYNSDSLKLTGSSNATAAYILTFLDGKVETFDKSGALTSITDRFGNKITFTHTSIATPVGISDAEGIYTDRLTITDSQNTVCIDYNLTNERILLPDGNAIRFEYSASNEDYLLTKMIDQEGNVTTFSYESNLCGMSDYSYLQGSVTNYTAYYHSYRQLYYNYLTRIVYPTKASTIYSYKKPTKYITYSVASRKDTVDGQISNSIVYSYDDNIKATTADYGKKQVIYEYDDSGFVIKETTKSNNNIMGWVNREFDKAVGLISKETTVMTCPEYNYINGNIPNASAYISKEDTYEYNSVGLITQQCKDGITTTNTYDTRFYVLTQSISSGIYGKKIKVTNTLSNDGKNILTSYVFDNDVLSGRTDYTYDSKGNRISIKKYASSSKYVTTNNTYFANGWISSSSTYNVTNSYTYDKMGRILTATDGNGNVTAYQYDKTGKLLKETYPNGASKSYVYVIQSEENDTIITDELGNVMTYRYDGLGRILSVYSSKQLVEKTDYDLYGRILSKTDANGAVSTFSYDYADRVISMSVADASAVGATYNETYEYEWVFATGLFKTKKTVVGDAYAPSTISISYCDVNGNVISDGFIQGGNEIVTAYTYDSFGNKICEVSARDRSLGISYTNLYSYDINGNITSIRNSVNQCTYSTYDWLGNMLTQTDLLGNVTTYTYDGLGHVLTETIPVDASESLRITKNYDNNGNVITEICESVKSSTLTMLSKSAYTYDNRNNLIQVKSYTTSGDYIVTGSYTYDAKGNMLSSTSGNYTTWYSYDSQDNVASITYPNKDVETFTYNVANNVITSTNRNGVTTSYSYNFLGDPLTITADGTAKIYQYTSTGKLLSETFGGTTTTYTYDCMGRMLTETSGGKLTKYSYDVADNITSISVGGNSTNYTYDQLNRLTKVENGTVAAEYSYDIGGRRVSTIIRNNQMTMQTTYAYNYAGNITCQSNYDSNGKLISQFSYTYYANGNMRTEADSTSGTTTYTYDMLGRLISEVGSGKSRYYTYDTVGNRLKVIIDSTTTVSYNYDSAGRLISETSNNGSTSTTTTYAYDKNGNLISKTEGTKKTAYAFDVWGNMTSGAGATYTYNASGLRTSKTVSGKKTTFTLVGGSVWSDGTSCYVWGAELITNGSVYYVYNAHGDVIHLLNASGAVTKTYDYDAYGNELSRDLNDANPFRYCGEYYDTETGFIYLRARYYDPTLGRFISQDSHWNVGNMIYGDNLGKNSTPDINAIMQSSNLYAYCINNPLGYRDYSGNEAILLITLIGIGLGALLGGAYGHQVAKGKGYSSSDGWDYYKYVLGCGLVGGTLGGVAAWEMASIASMYIGAFGTAVAAAKAASETAEIAQLSRFASSPLIENVQELYNKCVGHIFTDNHIKDGILKLGGSYVDIFNKFIRIINYSLDRVVEGQNNIRTTIDGIKTTITFFVKDGNIIKIDGYVGHSNRIVDNLIELIEEVSGYVLK